MSVDPLGLTPKQIHVIAEAFAQEVDFQLGDRIEPLIGRLGGRIQYHDLRDSLEDVPTIEVLGPQIFTVHTAGYLGPERIRVQLGIDLGIYVMHSKRGEVPLVSGNRYTFDPARREAFQFSSAFWMPTKKFLEVYGKRSPSQVASIFLVTESMVLNRASTLGLSKA